MLVALVVSLLVAVVSFLYGRAALVLLARAAGAPGEPDRLPFPIVALAGLAVLAALAGTWALCGGLGAIAFAAFLAGALLIAALRPRWLPDALRREAAEAGGAGPLGWLLLAAGVLFVLARAAGPVESYDTGTYHAPLIRWLESYGFVPGLGNLHGRLALSAGWLVPSALFSFVWLGGLSLHILNGTLLLLLLLWGITALAAWRRGERRASPVLRLLLPLAGLRFFGKWLSSPTPDVAAAALVWIVGVLALELAESAEGGSDGGDDDTRAGTLALLAGFAVTVKLSTLPLLLFPLFLAVHRLAAGKPRRAAALAAALVLPLAPAVAQSLVTSGYPVFPLGRSTPSISTGKCRERRRRRTWTGSGAGRSSPTGPRKRRWRCPFRSGCRAGGRRCAGRSRARSSPFVLLAPLRLAHFLIRRPRRPSRERLALHATVWAGALFWFFAAPAPRFGWGFVVLLALLLALPLLTAAARRLPPTALAALLLAALAWEAWQVRGWEPDAFPAAARHALVPADYPRPLTRRVVLGGIPVHVPVENDQCWHEPYPCTPTPDPRLTARGPGLADGFRSTD